MRIRDRRRASGAIRGGVVLAALTVSMPSLAYTECTGHVTSIYTGDGGNVWVMMDNTVPWYLYINDPNLKNILSSATTALVTGYSVVVRFQADGLTCAAGSPRGDVLGMYLKNTT
jgi:hypothetical protein